MRFHMFLTFFLLLVVQSCKEEIRTPQIPVDFTIDLLDPEFDKLKGYGNTISVFGGSRGIIITRINQTDFKAYDQHCPYDNDEPKARVSLEKGSTVFASCATCETKYNLFYGSPEEGPGTYPLTEYKAVYYRNSNRLRVYNYTGSL